MTAFRIALLGILPATALYAGDEDAGAAARARAIEARGSCFIRLSTVAGVNGVSYAGSGTDYRLLITVRDAATKQAAREKIGGDAWEGIPVLWSVASNQTVVAPAAEPAKPAASPNPSEPPPPGTNPAPPGTTHEPDCDIVRAQVGLPALRRPVGGTSWKSWVPCKVWLRSVAGPGGSHSYLYTKHRPGCGYRDGLFSPVVREGFTAPFEVRGSDISWWRQVAQDVENKFPAPTPPLQPKTTPYRRDAPVGR